jgi:hypothetical protein
MYCNCRLGILIDPYNTTECTVKRKWSIFILLLNNQYLSSFLNAMSLGSGYSIGYVPLNDHSLSVTFVKDVAT